MFITWCDAYQPDSSVIRADFIHVSLIHFTPFVSPGTLAFVSDGSSIVSITQMWNQKFYIQNSAIHLISSPTSGCILSTLWCFFTTCLFFFGIMYRVITSWCRKMKLTQWLQSCKTCRFLDKYDCFIHKLCCFDKTLVWVEKPQPWVGGVGVGTTKM